MNNKHILISFALGDYAHGKTSLAPFSQARAGVQLSGSSFPDATITKTFLSSGGSLHEKVIYGQVLHVCKSDARHARKGVGTTKAAKHACQPSLIFA